MTAAERRKKYLVEKTFQLKPVYLIAFAFLVITVIIEWQIFLLLKTVLPGITLMETKTEIVRLGIFIMIQLFVIFLVLAILTTLHLHRVIGPLARLTKEIDEMASNGNYTKLTVRKNDAIKKFIESLNRYMEKTRNKI